RASRTGHRAPGTGHPALAQGLEEATPAKSAAKGDPGGRAQPAGVPERGGGPAAGGRTGFVVRGQVTGAGRLDLALPAPSKARAGTPGSKLGWQAKPSPLRPLRREPW
ncbi:MAG: hypothetical protein ACRDZX_16145, partial [Acidimicrobiales bacterium]